MFRFELHLEPWQIACLADHRVTDALIETRIRDWFHGRKAYGVGFAWGQANEHGRVLVATVAELPALHLDDLELLRCHVDGYLALFDAARPWPRIEVTRPVPALAQSDEAKFLGMLPSSQRHLIDAVQLVTRWSYPQLAQLPPHLLKAIGEGKMSRARFCELHNVPA